MYANFICARSRLRAPSGTPLEADKHADQLQSLEARIEALEKKINQIPGSSKVKGHKNVQAHLQTVHKKGITLTYLKLDCIVQAITSLSLAQYPELARPAGPLLFPKMPSLDAGTTPPLLVRCISRCIALVTSCQGALILDVIIRQLSSLDSGGSCAATLQGRK